MIPSDEPDEGIAGALHARLRAARSAEPSPRRAATARVGDAMRLVIDRLVATDAPPEELAKAADQLEAIAATLETYPQARMYDGYAESANAGYPHALFDWSPLLGRANPLAPPISAEVIEGRVVGTVRFGSAYEGPPGCVHGGFVAAAFDEVLGMATTFSGHPGMTGTLSVRYRKPTPLRTELRFIGNLLGVEGRKISTSAELWAGDVMTAEAKGLFISVDLAKFDDMIQRRGGRMQG